MKVIKTEWQITRAVYLYLFITWDPFYYRVSGLDTEQVNSSSTTRWLDLVTCLLGIKHCFHMGYEDLWLSRSSEAKHQWV